MKIKVFLFGLILNINNVQQRFKPKVLGCYKACFIQEHVVHCCSLFLLYRSKCLISDVLNPSRLL